MMLNSRRTSVCPQSLSAHILSLLPQIPSRHVTAFIDPPHLEVCRITQLHRAYCRESGNSAHTKSNIWFSLQQRRQVRQQVVIFFAKYKHMWKNICSRLFSPTSCPVSQSTLLKQIFLHWSYCKIMRLLIGILFSWLLPLTLLPWGISLLCVQIDGPLQLVTLRNSRHVAASSLEYTASFHQF